MNKRLNCMNCCIGDFKESLCDCYNGICKEYKKVGTAEDFEEEVLKRTKPRAGGWIPCSERLPSEDGCYLVSTTGTNNDIIDIAFYTEEIWHKASRIKAWMPLPKPWKGADDFCSYGEREESEVEECQQITEK